MDKENIVVRTPYNTVVAKYESIVKQGGKHQTEPELEKQFIEQLQSLGYEYKKIRGKDEMENNLRRQIEKLNKIEFTENEWKKFFENILTNRNHGIKEKSELIHHIANHPITRDDGSLKNIYLLKKDNIDVNSNSLQVINQYVQTGQEANRYDVSILVNGLPLIHIELKKRGLQLKSAFDQITRYDRESFWAESGLFNFIQIFVISNGTNTRYYGNSSRKEHIDQNQKKRIVGNSYSFTTNWADGTNKRIKDLVDFTNSFFRRENVLNILTKYCVFTSEKELKIMRPYQIAATEKILNKIDCCFYQKQFSSHQSGGYIWHTTGSGKTLTSFKTAQLLNKDKRISKVLFVVDRMDLDHQTKLEYNKYQKGSANSTDSTKILNDHLKSAGKKTIVTTIQKLYRLIVGNPNHKVYKENVVFIFDECHRSQFGKMHDAITKSFKKYHLFGFTGTPIFRENASNENIRNFKTTGEVFGKQLHSYTIANAIEDKNVLGFHIKEGSTINDEELNNFSKSELKALYSSNQHIQACVQYILSYFHQTTYRNQKLPTHQQRGKGFNSMLATGSIELAKKYYEEFKRQQESIDENDRLRVAVIFSSSKPKTNFNGLSDESPENIEDLNQTDQKFLDSAIKEYNALFDTSFDVSSGNFKEYYTNVSKKVKEREIDLLIVVNMFLTGFDAPTLNTLWVDKNLRMHGLIQAFSRTNRIYNEVKDWGNIICFRPFHNAVDEAIAIFGDKEARDLIIKRPFRDYYEGYDKENNIRVQGYVNIANELQTKFPVGEDIIGESNKREFAILFGKLLKAKNTLESFPEFDEKKQLIVGMDLQNYRGNYEDIRQEAQKADPFSDDEAKKETQIFDDVIFEVDILRQIDVNVDYIIDLVIQKKNQKQSEEEIIKSIESILRGSIGLRNKRDLLIKWIRSAGKQWSHFLEKEKNNEIKSIVAEENLCIEKTKRFIEDSFDSGIMTRYGNEFSELLPSMDLFDSSYEKTEERVFQKLQDLFEKYSYE